MSVGRVLPWIVRVAWAVLPFAAGPAFADALSDRSRAVQVVASTGLWGVWAVVLCAAIVLHPISLTVVRAITPAAVVAAVVAGVSGASGAATAVAIAVAAIATVVAFLPETALPYVNGPAYPNERRYPLRPPGPLLLGPLLVAWLLSVVVPVCGALLLAARQWVAGGVAVVVGVAAAGFLGRSMYTLAKRWLVFVPAGVVLHDPMSLADPILFRRKDVLSLAPAAADTDATDVTARAFGLALELDVAEETAIALVKAGSRTAENVRTSKLLFTPSRPGAVVAEARERRLG